MAAHLLWEQEAAGSSPASPTDRPTGPAQRACRPGVPTGPAQRDGPSTYRGAPLPRYRGSQGTAPGKRLAGVTWAAKRIWLGWLIG